MKKGILQDFVKTKNLLRLALLHALMQTLPYLGETSMPRFRNIFLFKIFFKNIFMQPVNSPHSPYGMCRTVMKVFLSYFDYHNHNQFHTFIQKKQTSDVKSSSLCRTPCLGNTQMLASTPLLPHLATPRTRKLCVNFDCLCMFVFVRVFLCI